MAEYCTTDHGMRAELVHDENGNVVLNFFDPNWIRSDMILYDRTEGSLHAVHEGGEHYIRHIDADMITALEGLEELVLTALHSDGKPVRLRSPLGLLN